MTPQQINDARSWLAFEGGSPIPQQVKDTLEQALECAMEAALQEELDEAAISNKRPLTDHRG